MPFNGANSENKGTIMQALSHLFAMFRWLSPLILMFWLIPSAAVNPPLELEPNNTMGTATPYAIAGGEARGQLSSTTDIDYFVFSSTGGVVTFSLSPENSSYNGTAIQANLLAADGSVLASKNIDSDSSVVSLSIYTVSGSNYYLMFQKSQYSLMQKNYVINSSYTPGIRIEREPNNTKGTATAYAIADAETRGQLSSATDMDYFVFSSAGGAVTFTLTPEDFSYDGTSLQASILAADGSVLASKDISSDSTSVTLGVNTKNGSIYYLAFSKNQYSLMQKSYIINSAYTPALYIENEPNDSQLTASGMVGGGAIRGQLSSITDVDYFVFNTAGGIVNFSISPETSSYDGTSLAVSILSQDGAVLAGNSISSDSSPVSLGVSTVGGLNYYLKFSKNQYTLMKKDYVVTTSGVSLIGKPQTIGSIGFTPANLAVGGSTVASATATSGLVVTFRSASLDICTVTGNVVIGLAPGLCAIGANQGGDSVYAPATEVMQVFSVAVAKPGTPTILSIVPGPERLTITVLEPSNTGGSAIVSYSAKCTARDHPDATASSLTTSIVVKGLVPGVSYTCSATANNGTYTSSATPVTLGIPRQKVDLTPILMLLLD